MFNLTVVEFFDMYYSKRYYENYYDDKEFERTAWLSSMLMSSTGNYGKKGVDMKKIYKRQFGSDGEIIESSHDKGFKPIDRDVKNDKLNELIEQFNKDGKFEVPKVE